MTMRQMDLCWAAALCGVVAVARHTLRRRAVGSRHMRLLLGGDGGDVGSRPKPEAGAAVRLRRGRAALVGARPRWLVPELALLPAGLAACQALRSPLPLIAGAAAVVPLRRWRARRHQDRRARHRATAVIELCAALAAELRSGATPEQALETVTSRLGADRVSLGRLGPEPVARLAAGRYGGDVPAAFGVLAELPGGRGAAAIAACWQVASHSGAGLAGALDQVAEALRAERTVTEEIEGELAAPRTTVAVLAVLPLLGLLLGAGLRAHPLDILLHTPAGLACLVGGVALEAAGLAWTARIVRAARGAPDEPGRHPGTGSGAVSSGAVSSAVSSGADGAACGIARRRVAHTPAFGGPEHAVLR